MTSVKDNLNLWGQTESWESACLESRRNLESRRGRLGVFRIKKSDRVLDLGCGDGLNLMLLSEAGVNNLYGVDISKNLISKAKKNYPKAKFYLASAEKLPFKNNYFGIVLVDSVFHHFMRYRPSLMEIKRVLKRNGSLCFIEPHHSFFRFMLDFVSQLPIAKYLPWLKVRSRAYLGEKKFMDHWLETEEYFYQELKEQGFKEIVKKLDRLSIVGKYIIAK